MTYQVDPLAEKEHEVLPGFIWKYDERVLLMTTQRCPMNCAFCFRKHLYDETFRRASDKEITAFVTKNKAIREFIFSGGEPLTVMDDLISLTSSLVKLGQIHMFRIHSRLPVVFPQQVDLQKMEKLIGLSPVPFYLAIHVNHPQEIASEKTRSVLTSLRKIGYILLSHSVFLRGINDDEKTLGTLFSQLVELGIKPYHIFHCDNMEHTQPFIVPLKKEVRIMSALYKKLSGIAVPIHVVDTATGKGKVPVPTNYWNVDWTQYRDFSGQESSV